MAVCSPCSGGTSITVFAGRDYTASFTLTVSTSSGNVPYDLTGASVWFHVKNSQDDADTDALIQKRNTAAGGGDTEVLVTDATGGVLEVYILPTDTEEMSGEYVYDLVVENSSGKISQAIEPSTFKVRGTVTNFD